MGRVKGKSLAEIDRELFTLAGIAAKFATVKRATLLADGVTPESDTDHTVALGLVAMELADSLGYCGYHMLDRMLDRGKIAIYALVHDLPEVRSGDVNTLVITPAQRAAKALAEAEAVEWLVDTLGYASWTANRIRIYEEQLDREARFVKLVDKIMPKYTHELNRGAAFKLLKKTPEEIEAAHREQLAGLKAKYGDEFPEVIELIEVTMERAVRVYREALADRTPKLELAANDYEPLGCDCYGGCWGDHSEHWTRMRFRDSADASEAMRLTHQHRNGTPRKDGPEHGAVVLGTDPTVLRFAVRKDAEEHVERLKALGWPWPVGST